VLSKNKVEPHPYPAAIGWEVTCCVGGGQARYTAKKMLSVLPRKPGLQPCDKDPKRAGFSPAQKSLPCDSLPGVISTRVLNVKT
jgi:hypothetical protein